MIGAGLAPVAQARPETKGRYIVVLKPWSDARSVAREHQRLGVQPSKYFRHALRGYSATIPTSKLAVLRRDPRVASITRDRLVRIAAQSTPTGVRRIGGVKVGTGNGINVAVIDTGIDLTHPDLQGNIVGGATCVGANADDQNGHGSHVAGIIAAINNSIGVRGVAPGVKLWAVRVLGASGTGSLSDIICGIDFVDSKAPANGGPIKIANLSIEADGFDDGQCGFGDGDPMHQAICRLNDDGVTVIVAAGNGAQDMKAIVPAAYDEVLTVSALSDSDGLPCGLGGPTTWTNDDVFAPFSNYATLTKDKAHLIGAPGVDILSADNAGGYFTMSGTSMAAPHVSGAAARFLASHPGATPDDVKAALLAGGEPKNVVGSCTPGHFLHTDPSNKHAERVVQVPSIVTDWSRFPSSLDAATGSPYTHGR